MIKLFDSARGRPRSVFSVAGRSLASVLFLSAFCVYFGISMAWCQSAGKLRVAFIGDSMAEGYWDGIARLVDQDTCLKAHLDILRFSKDSTGLLRAARYDWPAELRRIDARIKPQLFVLTVGANDVGSDEKYKDRITALLDAAKKTDAALLWIGLPAMRTLTADRDAREKNKLIEETILGFGSPKIEYVKPWKYKDVEEDRFSSYGPDRNQSIVQIRMTDGVHFTFAGNLITGIYLLPRILERLGPDGKVICGRTEAQAR